jgi:hypothetical protein
VSDLGPLIDRVLDGSADDAEQARLADALRGDRQARAAWWAEVAWRGNLRQVLAASRAEASGRRQVVRWRQRCRGGAARRWIAWAAAAALAIGTGLALVWAESRAPTPMAVETQAIAGNGNLRFGDGTVLVFAEAQATVDRTGGGRVVLERGRLEARIAPRAAGERFVVATPHGDLTVVGTAFLVAVDAQGALLRVSEGVVEVRGRRVDAGGSALFGHWGVAAETIVVEPDAGPTLAEAVSRAGPDSAIVLAPGVHARGGDDQALARMVAAGEPGRPARLLAMPGARAQIRSAAWDALRISGRHVVVSGLDLIGAPDGQGNGMAIASATDIVIRDCRFEGFGGDGLNARQVDGLLIEDCAISGNGSRSRFGQGGLAVFRGRAVAATVLRRLDISGNATGPVNAATGTPTGGQGILVGRHEGESITGELLIENCRIVGNQGPGVMLTDAGEVRIRDSRILRNGSGPVGDLRVQVAASKDSRLRLVGSTLAAGADSRLLRIWEPAVMAEATGNGVWGEASPGDGFALLPVEPTGSVR